MARGCDGLIVAVLNRADVIRLLPYSRFQTRKRLSAFRPSSRSQSVSNGVGDAPLDEDETCVINQTFPGPCNNLQLIGAHAAVINRAGRGNGVTGLSTSRHCPPSSTAFDDCCARIGQFGLLPPPSDHTLRAVR